MQNGIFVSLSQYIGTVAKYTLDEPLNLSPIELLLRLNLRIIFKLTLSPLLGFRARTLEYFTYP